MQLLSTEITAQMSGRVLSWELFPFSFRQFLDFRGVKEPQALSTKSRITIWKAFEEYWESGGLPEVAGVSRDLRIRIHQKYFSAILFRDLVECHGIAHPWAFADLAYRIAKISASFYTVNRLRRYLKSLGHRARKSSVSEHFDWFEDAYFLFTVRILRCSERT